MRGVSWKANTRWERGVVETRLLPSRQLEGTEGCVPARDGKGHSWPVGKRLQREAVRRVPHATKVLWRKLVTTCPSWAGFHVALHYLMDNKHCDLGSPRSRLLSLLDYL